MNRTPRLSKSGIEYLTHSWGIWSGCLNLKRGICSVTSCWAKGITVHFPKLYPDGFNPHFYPEALDSPKHLKEPSIIGVGWVGDIIGYCEAPAVKIAIMDTVKATPWHTYLFLTKNPDRLIEWEFPDNCWVGVTATEDIMFLRAIRYLHEIEAKVKYISFEPLLSAMFQPATEGLLLHGGISWVIIGAQTNPYKPPRIEWVQEIVEAADKAGIPVFLKDNLKPLIAEHNKRICDDCEAGDPCFACGAVIPFRQDMPAK